MRFRLFKIFPFNIILLSIIGLTLSSCSISLKKSSRRNVAQIIKTPKIDKASFWGKRLVTLTYAQGKPLDASLLGRQCGYEVGLKGIKECVRLGADINFKTKEGMTALLGAVEKGDHLLVKDLLNLGADISLGDNQGLTPIMKASLLGNFEVVKVLVERGANLGPIKEGNWRGMRPLDIADFYLHKKVAHYLRIKMGWPLL
tara:strand:- start:213 stop:815 length:603 start_codon:yes stop_codon:yes gene_type:complete